MSATDGPPLALSKRTRIGLMLIVPLIAVIEAVVTVVAEASSPPPAATVAPPDAGAP